MNAQERYEYWLMSPDVDEGTKAELRAIADDPVEIEDRFYQELSFGTAGLRGVLGAGDNRMNVYNVRKATEGLARHLKERFPAGATVAIAYDSRNFSDVFARETACVLAGHGVHVYLFSTLHAVPQLSFTVLHLKCSAGVVITASHNPPKYNGYKVYWSTGGQVDPVEADAITARIREVEGFATGYMAYEEALAKGLIELIGQEVDEAYYAATMSLLQQPKLLQEKGKNVTMVYTPLHGSGYVPVTTVLDRIGMKNVFPVPEQVKPDGNFPTVKAPNPEDPNAFTLAFKLAEEKKADVIIGTDPDSDRLGVAVRKHDGAWAVLTGNQIGSILLYCLLTAKKEAGLLPENGLVVRSLVSTPLADAICASFGVEIREVLTGFRFISEQIAWCEATHERTFLFGFEESFGFLAGGFSRDKDAICAAMLVAEGCTLFKEQGLTLYDVLQKIYQTYGYYKEKTVSYTLEGKAGIEKIQGAMKQLQANPPQAIGGKAKRINVIMPFLYGGRQHKRAARESLDCASAMIELQNLGVTNIITFDAHDSRVSNAIPLTGFENVHPYYQLMKSMLRSVPDIQVDKEHLMMISPDEGGIHRNLYYSTLFGLDLGIFVKRRDFSRIVNGRNPIVAHEFIGSSVKGKDVLIMDDMLSSGDSILDIAKELKRRKAGRVFAGVTFAMFTDGIKQFDQYYKKGLIDKIFSTNLTYRRPELADRPWFVEVSMSKYIAKLVDALNYDESISALLDPQQRIMNLLERHNRGEQI